MWGKKGHLDVCLPPKPKIYLRCSTDLNMKGKAMKHLQVKGKDLLQRTESINQNRIDG